LPVNLMSIFEHLRTLQHILQDYTPRQVLEKPSHPGEIRYQWQEGTLLFTDLAGFTALLEANTIHGPQGAAVLLTVLNRYFSEMIEIIGKSGGDLLEFTGDAMLVQFLADAHRGDMAQAIRSGMRMQRAMTNFMHIETPQGQFSLEMRVGIHAGRFLKADIGTPTRMAHVLFGNTVRQAKRAEGMGKVGRVCLTKEIGDRLAHEFQLHPLNANHVLVQDTLSDEQLGEYDITLTRRRLASPLLLDRSPPGLIAEIKEVIKRVELLASYLPTAILNLLVENAAQRFVPPDFPVSTVLFINLKGLPESVDVALPEEMGEIVGAFSKLFSFINETVTTTGGILQKVTYHSIGSDILIYFGVLNSYTDDSIRAVDTALTIRQIITQFCPPHANQKPIKITCRMGLALGPVFAAEIGELRGRREFNILGDPVNIAARLMTQASPNQILITQTIRNQLGDRYTCESLGNLFLKGKTQPVLVSILHKKLEN
jgi:class 3 adenylate cyclase